MINIFKPAPHIERVPEEQVDLLYKRLRVQIFVGIFIGYAAYYSLFCSVEKEGELLSN